MTTVVIGAGTHPRPIIRFERVPARQRIAASGRPEWEQGYWMLWQTTRKDFSEGTYLRLGDDGSFAQVTRYEDGTEAWLTVKPKDGGEN